MGLEAAKERDREVVCVFVKGVGRVGVWNIISTDVYSGELTSRCALEQSACFIIPASNKD